MSHHDAEDVLHDFMAKLLRLNAFQNLEEDKGRLRTFLARSLDRFLISHHHRESRREAREVPVDDLHLVLEPGLEQRFKTEASPAELGPDVMFDRRWCAELLTRVLRLLEAVKVMFIPLFALLLAVTSRRSSQANSPPVKVACRPPAPLSENTLGPCGIMSPNQSKKLNELKWSS